MKHLSGLQLWHLFKYAELNDEVIMQNEKLFVDLLNKVWLSNIGDDVEKLTNTRFKHEHDESYPKDALHVHAENEFVMKRNNAVLNNLPGEIYKRETDDKTPGNCKYPLATIQVSQNQKQTNTKGLAKFLKLKIVTKMMLAVNLDI